MRGPDSFSYRVHRIFQPLERVHMLVAAVLVIYSYWALRRVDVHSLSTFGPLLVAYLVTFGMVATSRIRRRRNAGIYAFHTEHTSRDSLAMLRCTEEDYLYFGETFATTLAEFEAARKKDGMAAEATVRLLLADTGHEPLMKFLATRKEGGGTAEGVRRDLRKKQIAAMEALAGVGKLEIRLHREFNRCWIHVFDSERITFGMLPKGVSGEIAPAIEVAFDAKRQTLFDYFLDYTHQVWEEAAGRTYRRGELVEKLREEEKTDGK